MNSTMRKTIPFVALVLAGMMSTASAAPPASAAGVTASNTGARDILIRGAKVYTASARGTLDNADVLIRDGRIAAVSAGGAERASAPSSAEVIDAHGRALTPGIFAGLTRIGVEEISAEPSTADGRADFKSPSWDQQWRPEFDVTLAYNPRSTLIPIARVEGLTWTVLAPESGDSIIAGQGAAVAFDGRLEPASRAVLDGSRSLFVEIGSDGNKASGGSRAAQFMLLDQAIAESRAASAPGTGALLHPAGRAVLGRYVGGSRVVFDVERASDILAVLAFADRNRMKAVISGGSEAWLVAGELARAHVPVILNPLQDLPNEYDRLGSRLDNAARLQRAGVLIAFSTGENHNARVVRQAAGNSVAHGLPWDAALAAITANPAEIFGLGGSRGRIEKGQVADLVLWDGDPLEVTSAADQTWIGGHAVEMRSRQTELRDRYLHRAAAR